MELKVWVEGIQRIVCGVNEKTTCQDVVYALAHATGKTGRFTLIERWRNSERLLAPNEQPLKVLLKWGEHSNDVQFILHWAPLESASAKTTAGAKLLDAESVKNNPSLVNASGTLGKSGSSRTRTTDIQQQHNLMKRKESSNSASAVQTVASRTSEGGGGVTEGANLSNVDDATASVNRTPTNYSHDNGDSDGSPSKPFKDLRISSPPPYREPPNPGTTRGPVSANQPKGLPPYREPPPPNLNSQNSAVRFSSSASLHNQKQSTASVNNVSPMLPNSAGETKSNMQEPSTIGKHIGGISEHLTNSSDQRTMQIPKEYSSTNGADTTSGNGILPKKTVSPISTANPQYQELVRLINVQRDKLTTQHAELTQYDAEIVYWEGKAKEQQRHLDFITKEISRLELYSAQQESQVLSLMHLEQENDIVAQESESLQSEIDRLRKEYEKCEKDVANCRSKIGHLTQELQIQRGNAKQRQEEWKKRESATLAEIDILKQELELARRETEAVTDLSGNLDREVNSLEADLAGKKKQMERLLNAMKEANLQSLTIQSPDELVDQSSHHRSGSTRKMIGSPRQLENAAPTSKNPHGVWV